MKAILKPYAWLIFSVLIVLPTILDAQSDFTKGVNLTGWFQTSSVKSVQFTKFTRQNFVNIKSLGCDVIRLPIDMTAMTNGSPDYLVDPLFYFMLDSAVHWAEDLQIHLILDNHTMDPAANTDPAIGTMLQKIWVQVAEHYKGSSSYIYYELRNEPHGITTAKWGTIEKDLITAIRAIDTVHTIVVGASGWNTYSEMSQMPVFADTNLIYTFHFYDPFLFTHQGATWPSPSMGSLAGVPFPYDAASMPACPADLKGTWIEGSLANSYKTDGTVAKVKQLIDQAVAFKTTRKVKVYCGEFGVYDLNSDTADRVSWYETVRNYLEEKGISWTIWDYQGGFGIFRKGTDGFFNSDLNVPMVTALGLTAPEQKPYVMEPDSATFPIYSTFVQSGVIGSTSVGSGTGDFYYPDTLRSGRYCIQFANVPQYNNIGFDFVPNRDFSYLKTDGYFLEFWVRANVNTVKFDVRFIDTKTGPDDHPWRMRRIIDKSIVAMDGNWHYLKLPLTSFTEHGSWDGTWFSPTTPGSFDWKAIDRLEIVSEEGPLTAQSLWFFNISVSKTSISTGIANPGVNINPASLNAWPNPVNKQTSIFYHLGTTGQVNLDLYSITGNKVCTFVNRYQDCGDYTIPFEGKDQNGNQLKPGIYICRLSCGVSVQTLKMVVE